MKRLIFLLAFLPGILHSQTCKPYASLAGRRGTSDVLRKDLATLKTLEVGGECGDAKVISFEFTLRVKGQPTSYTGFGAGISSEMKAALEKTPKNGRVFFDNVKAKFPDGTIQPIPGITLVVKD